MPAKTVTCTICENTVTKRKTRDIGNGLRACRTHEETEKAIIAKEQKEEQARFEKEEAARREREAKRAERESSLPLPHALCCYICKREGIHEEEFYYRRAIGSRKVELKYGTDLLPEQKEEKLKEQFFPWGDKRTARCLRIYPCSRKDKHQRYLFAQVKDKNLKSVISLIGKILLCDQCIKIFRAKRPELSAQKIYELENIELPRMAQNPEISALLTAIATKELAQQLLHEGLEEFIFTGLSELENETMLERMDAEPWVD